jgi:cell division protein FtsL
MKHWILDQFYHLNFLMILIMIIFVTAMGRANLTKQLKAQNEEVYKEFEELKDEIREHHSNMTALINLIGSKK